MSYERLNPVVIDELRDLLDKGFPVLIERFSTDIVRRLNLIEPAIDILDFDVIHHEAHGIKGSCRNIGADQLAHLCSDLESKGREGDATEIAQIFAAAKQEFAALSGELGKL